MKKLFISQPMNGKTDEEIFKEREIAVKQAKEKLNDDVEIINSYCREDGTPLDYLAYSIKCLAKADIAYFAKGWQDARGCLIENSCANAYGIDVILSEFDPRKTVIGRRLYAGLCD